VLDPNVIISALLSTDGAPARVLRAWIQGAFEIVLSPHLLEELGALGYPKLRKRITEQEADRVIGWLEGTAVLVADPSGPPSIRSPDPGDDFLIALAEAERAVLVSGDQHLLGLAQGLPILSPVDFLRLLEDGGAS